MYLAFSTDDFEQFFLAESFLGTVTGFLEKCKVRLLDADGMVDF